MSESKVEKETQGLGATRDESIGTFRVSIEEHQIRIMHEAEPNRVLWSSLAHFPMVAAELGEARVEESRGFFQVSDSRSDYVAGGFVDEVERKGAKLELRGSLGDQNTWFLELEAIDEAQLRFRVYTSDARYNRLSFSAAMSPEAKVFGLGQQFTHLDLKGRRVPILSQEPGIGRGLQPLTWMMDRLAKAGGTWHNSNAPVPCYLSTDLQGLCLENHEYSIFDFSSPDRVTISAFSGELSGRIFYGDGPVGMMESLTRFTGRMRALPEWIGKGAVIGMQGGTAAVHKMQARLDEAGAPVSAFWLQDWVGARKTSIGWQLWWNWELDEERYPGWGEMVSGLKERGIRVMSYLNPFLVNPREKGNFARNLYEEAESRGFLIGKGGRPYQILNTSFSAAMLDLANPEACVWVKELIKDQMIATGVSGWMADFGEALPFDAELFEGCDAAEFHNRYPEEWARVNREAVEEAGLDDEIVFFMRSGYTRSPRFNTLFWMGDQLTSWSREDGIKSTVVAMLSSGMSGMSFNHSDIGGYTATTVPGLPFKVPGLGYTRGRELLHRWIELNAFTPVFRTHEGNQPGRHFQIDGDQETLQHFARFARIFAALAPYRQGLVEEAAERGIPVIRHPWLHYPSDPQAREVELQFMLGPDLMVAPVMDAGAKRVDCYLPEGQWRHLWTGEVLSTGSYSVAAPPGAPAVFCRESSELYAQLAELLDQNSDRDLKIPDLIRPQ